MRALLLFLLLAQSAAGAVYVVPVATAQHRNRTYTTTLFVHNATSVAVRCESVYAIPHDPRGGTLRATYHVAARTTQVETDVLRDAGAIGTLRIACNGEVIVATRIQTSTEGTTLDAGRVFRAVGEENPITSAASRRIVTARDLVVMEVGGVPVQVHATVRDAAGAVLAERAYELPAFAQQLVNLANLRDSAVSVELTVEGEGAVVLQTEGDATAARLVAAAHPTSTASHPASALAGLPASFKAAPFQEAATGLVMMRDRWYDPRTGTFITPDPEGNADSPNLYTFAGGDPVNNSDPTGRYIEERDILNSPLRDRYIRWRDAFTATPLGRQWWDAVHRSTTFTLHMRPMQQPYSTRGAVATRLYDQAGKYTSGEITFSPLFATTEPGDATLYPRGTQLWNSIHWPWQRDRFRVYAFGHEFGHILWGFDRTPALAWISASPTEADLAQMFNTFAAYQLTISTELRALTAVSQPTPQQQQRLAFLRTEDQRLRQIGLSWQTKTEGYGDYIGYEFYRSWVQQQRPADFHGMQPQLPPGILPPP